MNDMYDVNTNSFSKLLCYLSQSHLQKDTDYKCIVVLCRLYSVKSKAYARNEHLLNTGFNTVYKYKSGACEERHFPIGLPVLTFHWSLGYSPDGAVVGDL